MTVYEYRCARKAFPGCDTENWHEAGTGPYPDFSANDKSVIGVEWRVRPEGYYLGDFGPNNGMREAAMDRVGEVRERTFFDALSLSEAGAYFRPGPPASKYSLTYAAGEPAFNEQTLKKAMADLYSDPAGYLGVKPGDAVRVDSFGTTPAERAKFPLYDGLLAYFPDALAWVSRCSYEGSQQHHPSEPMHWDMEKSTDHENKIMRHMMAGFTDDTDKVPHSVKVAWRALARAQQDLMRRKGAPMPPNARAPHAERDNLVNQRDEE